MSAARPVTSIPPRTSRSRRRLANHCVGLPADTDIRNGASPGRMKPASVSAVSPGRCSDQTKVAWAAVVTMRLTSGRSPASGSTARVPGAPSRGPGPTVTFIRFSAAFSAPKSAPDT